MDSQRDTLNGKPGTDEMSADRIAAQLAKIVQSPGFKRSKRMRHFLEYVVDKTLSEDLEVLKEYNIALDVFDRDENFDPSTNALVRVEAGRLRKALKQYYLTAGADDPIVIEVPKGSYSAEFHPGGEQAQPVTAVKPAAPRDKPAIAVLAFKNLSEEATQEYISEGIAEDILIKLSRFREFRVVARNSSFSFKDQAVDMQTISTELGVDYILQGGVRTAEQRVRISAQLVETGLGHQVWADRYDRVLEDIFDLQDEIATTIATAINPAFTQAELNRSLKKPPEHLGAWDLVLKARHALNKGTAENIAQAKDFAEQAVALAPENPAALTLLANHHILDAWFGDRIEPKASMAEAIEYARCAVNLDKADPAALATLGFAMFGFGKHEDALGVLRQALNLNANYARGQFFYGYALACSGAYGEAITAVDRAISLSPREPVLAGWIAAKSIAAFVVKKHEEGIEFGYQAVKGMPGFLGAQQALAANLSELGRSEEAKSSVQTILQLSPGINIGLLRSSWPFKSPQDLERFCTALARAGLPE